MGELSGMCYPAGRAGLFRKVQRSMGYVHPGRHREISVTCVQHDHNGIISRYTNDMKAMTKPDLPGYPEVNYHPDDFPIVLLDD